jgi:hypothetical protein
MGIEATSNPMTNKQSMAISLSIKAAKRSLSQSIVSIVHILYRHKEKKLNQQLKIPTTKRRQCAA